jgi:hypothetical protein
VGAGGAKQSVGGSTASGGSRNGSGGSQNGSGGNDGGTGGAPGAGGGPITNPVTDLPVGVWTDVTPQGALGATGVYHLGIAPSDPAIVYVASDKEGMYKTTDAGKSWARLGNPNGYNADGKTDYLEDPCNIEVDPQDPNHVYATEGVDGGRDGFWISTDGGSTWAIPQGFKDVATIVGGGYDVVEMEADPVNFKHVIVSPHSDWAITSDYASGILESTDGGQSWTYHLPPSSGAWAAGSKGVHVLHHPASGTGDENTWLVCDEGTGFWRTTDAGKSWSNVSSAKGPHGGNQSYYAPNGVLYAGANYGQTVRSTDNGVTWQALTALPYSHYRAVYGGGGKIYTRGSAATGASPFFTSADSDGITWANDTAQGMTSGGTWEMGFDPVNQILYTANTSGGLWALRVK